MMMVLYLTCIVIVLWTVYFRLKRRKMYELADLIPSSEEKLPFIGDAHKFLRNSEEIMSALKEYSYLAIRKGGIAHGWLGPLLYVYIVDPVDIEFIFKTCLEKDDLHRFLRKVNGNGGIFAPVSIWRRRRKILMPTFSPKIVERFVDIFSKQSAKLVENLADAAGTGLFSIWPFISSYTLDSVCETTMGIKMGAQENPDVPFLKAMNTVLDVFCSRIFHLWLQPEWLFKFFPQYKVQEECLKVLHGFTNEIIERKREKLKNELQHQSEPSKQFDIQDYKVHSFLDMLIRFSGGERGYSNEELREEVLTLIIAGTDTSATTIGYTLKLLAMYPKVQEKVYAEINEIFGDSKRPLVKEDLLNLKCLDRVVKESLRLYTPTPFITRKIEKEIKLPSKYILPAGAGITAPLFAIHRDPKYWGADAEHFDPDRFLPERFNLTHPCSYMPFSHGPRNCVGYQYAMMSIKTALTEILRKYTLYWLGK